MLACPDVFDGKINKDDTSIPIGCQWMYRRRKRLRGLSFQAMYWIRATGAQAALGRLALLRGSSLQDSRNPRRCLRRSVSDLMKRSGFFLAPDPAVEEHESAAICWGEPRLVDLVVDDDELMAEEVALRNEFGYSASDIKS